MAESNSHNPRSIRGHTEGAEYITNRDLVLAANQLLGGITLDVASSKVANEYVCAENFYTPVDDGLNEQTWYDSCYLFPPSGAYYWDQSAAKWKMTRTSALSLTSSHAVWFRRMYHAWLTNEIKQGLYFSNCPDLIRYEPKIFKFPMCILRVTPMLFYNKNNEITSKQTCTSFLVYFPPQDSPTDAVDLFAKIYGERGHLLL
jgi:hypothetical protein